MIIRLKRVCFSTATTKYDETDAIKRMKDSDILAEKKRPTSASGGKIAGSTLVGAGVGAGLASAANMGMKALGKGGIKGGKAAGIGAAAGAVLGLMSGSKTTKEHKANSFYNSRLEEAQRKARRREKIDWKSNINNRESYTY